MYGTVWYVCHIGVLSYMVGFRTVLTRCSVVQDGVGLGVVCGFVRFCVLSAQSGPIVKRVLKGVF